MSCGCTQTPCVCGAPSVMPVIPCCEQTPCSCGTCPPVVCVPMGTLCDLDRRNNIWVEGVVDENGVGGICMLDTMEEYQVVSTLQRSQRAKDDLLKVTGNEYLRNLARTVPLLPTGEEGDQLQKEVNANAQSIPFYALFRGQPPFAQ
jgi:hypothetical protein